MDKKQMPKSKMANPNNKIVAIILINLKVLSVFVLNILPSKL